MDTSRPNLKLRGCCEELGHVTVGLTDGLGIMKALFMASKDKISFDFYGREWGRSGRKGKD